MTKSSTEWLTSPEAPERIAGLLGGEQSGIRITAPDPLGDSNHQLKVRTGLGFGSGVLVYDDPPRPALDDDLRACVEEMLGLPAGTLRRPQVASPVPSAGCGGLPMIAPSDWQDQPVPARQWFVPGMIPARNVTLLSGDGGLGKSLLALQLGVASALNKPMLDLTPAPGRVLYVGAEDEADEFQRRMADILRHMGADFAALDNFRLVSLADRDALLAAPDRTGTLLPTPLFAELADKIDDFKPRFIVLDTCADLFGGDEIKPARGKAEAVDLELVAPASRAA